MKEAKVSIGPKVEIIDSPIPEAGRGQVVIKVAVSGSNPKDWKMAERSPQMEPFNQGDDIAGTIYSVGEGVTEFRRGDRVAAFHEIFAKHGSYAEYAVAWAHTTFFLPEKTSFEGGGCCHPTRRHDGRCGTLRRRPPEPPSTWSPATAPMPLVVYGACSAVGSYVLQLAQRSNIHPLICVAGRAQEHVEKLIDRSKGDTIVDYRTGDAAVVQGIQDALQGQKLEYAYDAVTDEGSRQNISQVLDKNGGNVTLVLPPPSGWDGKFEEIPEGITQSFTVVGSVHQHNKDLGYVYFRYFTRGLEEGWFQGQPQEVVPGGLGGIQSALEKLKDGTASAVKYVFRISDTPGDGSGH